MRSYAFRYWSNMKCGFFVGEWSDELRNRKTWGCEVVLG